MTKKIILLALRSVRFYRKQVVYQIIITGLLSAVITGSLHTGWSVRNSLKASSASRLGKTGIIVSSGTRYFDPTLASRFRDSAGIKTTGLLETVGFCQNMNNQKAAAETHIRAVENNFFAFHNIDQVKTKNGEIIVNEKLAEALGLKKGDDLIIRFRNLSDIPSDAPFSPGKDDNVSVVLKVSEVIGKDKMGDFSLSVNQLVPYNIFMSLDQLNEVLNRKPKINRLLVNNNTGITVDEVHAILKTLLSPSDLGMRILRNERAGMTELRSDRIFIDKTTVDAIGREIPGSAPLITYLGNSFNYRDSSTPYSFISALPDKLYPEADTGKSIIINRWMAQDLNAGVGGEIKVSWFAPDSLNKLTVRSENFIVKKIVEIDGKWADSLLMPDFPGIAGSESCSDWDAGVLINFSKIRKKDEEYWKKFHGTPKAFISYSEGEKLWGSNFGSATAIRFPATITPEQIREKLRGRLEPAENGFIIQDLENVAMKAANEGVDFGSLFLSLGAFLILSAFILLAFAFSSYLEARHEQIRIYFALGFTRRWQEMLILTESASIITAGALAGAVSGLLFNMIIIHLLNTVWQGAVQMNTLTPYAGIIPVMSGFISTAVVSLIFISVRLRRYIKRLGKGRKITGRTKYSCAGLILLICSVILSFTLLCVSLMTKKNEIILFFFSGSFLFVSMILALRQYVIRPEGKSNNSGRSSGRISRLYYSVNPSNAILPVLFIAAGIFAVFITGANRLSPDSEMKRSGGTGGFLLWCDNSIPMKTDPSQPSGIRELGLDDTTYKDMKIVALRRYAGDDASCLNLNHVTMPPVLGVDADEFISRGAFSFAKSISVKGINDPWQFLNLPAQGNTIYGIADQTVLDWGMMIRPGDTLVMRSENGQRLNIIMAGGLKSSVFQGYVLIGMSDFRKHFPSVSGSSVLLIDGDHAKTSQYRNIITDRLEGNGVEVTATSDRLSDFNRVTNTYLSVFGVFGILGMISGVAGLGFILLRNYNYRRREFALMLATGFTLSRIKRIIFREQLFILIAGMITGIVPAIIATVPSLSNNHNFPATVMSLMVTAILVSGIIALMISVRNISSRSITSALKRD